MSILIKTMTNLPEHCYDCPCHDGESGYCQADKEHRYSDYRPFWCPLENIGYDECEVTLKMELGGQADILYHLLTEQMIKAEIKAESEE